MGSINSDEIISVLREEIENFDKMSRDSEVGTVIAVGDGIARIYGIDHAMYGEIVTFENGLKGMVQDIRRDEIGCILFGILFIIGGSWFSMGNAYTHLRAWQEMPEKTNFRIGRWADS